MDDESIEADLRTRIAEGDSEARVALGKFLFLTKTAQDAKDEGAQLLLDAAHDGHADAAHMLALITACDPELEDNWVFALAYLGRAAKAGHRFAQRQLAFLAGEMETEKRIAGGENFPADTWYRLHDAIDSAAALTPPAPQIISSAPYIATVQGFIAPAICDWIVERARPLLAPAKVYNPEGGGASVMTRSNSEARFVLSDLDMVLSFVRGRIATLMGLGQASMEATAVLHYAVGQEFKQHYDFINPKIPVFAAEIEKIGQRLATVLIYLNDDFDGGETEFLKLGKRYKGKKGDVLLFHNIDKDGAPDFSTLHAGRATTRGEKWLLSQWLRKRPV